MHIKKCGHPLCKILTTLPHTLLCEMLRCVMDMFSTSPDASMRTYTQRRVRIE